MTMPVQRAGSPEVHTPVGDAPIIPVAMVLIGAYLAWFGIHYWRSDTKWPTDPIKAVLQGKPVPVPSGQTSSAQIASNLVAAQPGAGAGSGTNPLGQGVGATPTPATGSAGQNQAAAKMIAISMGHADWTTGQQWADWVALWDGESGWSATARNPSSAYGIAQFLDSTWATVGCTRSSDPATQIRCGILYIERRYGSPSAAYAFWRRQSPHWY